MDSENVNLPDVSGAVMSVLMIAIITATANTPTAKKTTTNLKGMVLL